MQARCSICGEEKEISNLLGICVDCIRERWEDVKNFVMRAHLIARARFSLPPTPPKTKNGIRCNLCSNECIIGEGEVSYCGLKSVKDGKLMLGTWQSIMFVELDGPRNRKVFVKILS